MARGAYLGEFEELVLLAVQRTAEPCGMEIRREIADRTGRDVSIGAIYATVERLRLKRLVMVRDPMPHLDRGRTRRFFSLTVAGKQALTNSEKMRRRLRLDLRRRVQDEE
jgi:PadR family transcriptional regulator PadR